MTHQDTDTTRLRDYIAEVLPWAHGHQLKGITIFVAAIIEKQTGNQAELARGLGKQEAAVKRLARLLHNERLAPHRLADAVLAQALRHSQGQSAPGSGLDAWGSQHLRAASLVMGRARPSIGPTTPRSCRAHAPLRAGGHPTRDPQGKARLGGGG
jgi:hypothetical protein